MPCLQGEVLAASMQCYLLAVTRSVLYGKKRHRVKEVGELGCLFYGEAYDEVPIRMRACGQWQAGVGVDAKVGLGAQPKHEQAASAVQDLSIPAKGGAEHQNILFAWVLSKPSR